MKLWCSFCETANHSSLYHVHDLHSKLLASEKEVERLQSSGIHTCHEKCQNWICLLRREREELRERLGIAVVALEYYSTQSPVDIASDCDFADSCGFTVFKQGKRAREALQTIALKGKGEEK